MFRVFELEWQERVLNVSPSAERAVRVETALPLSVVEPVGDKCLTAYGICNWFVSERQAVQGAASQYWTCPALDMASTGHGHQTSYIFTG